MAGGINSNTVKEVLNLSLANVGSTYINDTTADTGEYFAIQIITDAVFTKLTDSTMGNSADIIGDTILAGTIIFGNFTAITLSGGAVLAYKRS